MDFLNSLFWLISHFQIRTPLRIAFLLNYEFLQTCLFFSLTFPFPICIQVAKLSDVHGSTLNEVVRSLLKRLFATPLAMRINWTGRNEKKEFQGSNSCSLVLGNSVSLVVFYVSKFPPFISSQISCFQSSGLINGERTRENCNAALLFALCRS